MTAQQIYDLAVDRVKTACSQKNAELMNLEEIGFEKKNLNDGVKAPGRAPNELYTLIGDDGNKVEVLYYAYDPTKTFGPIEPDLNKFTVTLFEGQKAGQTYRDDYPDPPYGTS